MIWTDVKLTRTRGAAACPSRQPAASESVRTENVPVTRKPLEGRTRGTLLGPGLRAIAPAGTSACTGSRLPNRPGFEMNRNPTHWDSLTEPAGKRNSGTTPGGACRGPWILHSVPQATLTRSPGPATGPQLDGWRGRVYRRQLWGHAPDSPAQCQSLRINLSLIYIGVQEKYW